MRWIFDTVTATLEDFVQKNILSLFDECYDYAWSDASRLVYPKMDVFRDNPQQIEEVNQRLMKRMKSICENYPLFKLLILSRKVPISVASGFFQKFASTYASQTTGLSLLFTESMLFSTNCALMYSPNNLTIQAIRERNFIRPSDEEMRDAIRLILFSFLHRHNMFCLNSMARRDLTVETSFDHLLGIYNQRIRSHLNARVSKNEEDAVFVLTLIQRLPFSNIIDVLENDIRYRLFLQNYFPVPVNGDDLRKKYGYLEGDDFTTRMGMSFQEFWKSWVVLNKLLLWSLPTQWVPDEVYRIDSPGERLRLERLFDICETGLGGGSLSNIRETCFDFLSEHYPDLMPSKSNYQKFIDTVMCERLDKRVVEFIEQPYTFYKVGPDSVLWDHLRQAGLFKAIARDILPLSGAIGKRKGEVFEETVEDKMRAMSGMQDIRRNIKIKSDSKINIVLEIDIAFIYKRVLFLLELKSNFKPIQYYNADGVVVTDRITGIESALLARDKKLVKYAEDIRKWWPKSDIFGAIYVYCTDEAEFIPSFNLDFWFKVGQYPRICLVEELIDFLQNMDLADLLNHPRFVKLSS